MQSEKLQLFYNYFRLSLDSKQKIRKQIRVQRQSLSEFDQQSAGLAVFDQLKKFHRYQSAKRTAIYLANDGELPLSAVANNIWHRKKGCYLPVIFGYHHRKMHFAIYHRKTPFFDNRYGIPEPDIHIRNQIKPMDLDLVLMPLVAFDKTGNRIGMGGGFYDRSFAFLKRRRYWKKPCLIGVAYDFQEVERLQKDDWDIPLDAIVTPSRLLIF